MGIIYIFCVGVFAGVCIQIGSKHCNWILLYDDDWYFDDTGSSARIKLRILTGQRLPLCLIWSWWVYLITCVHTHQMQCAHRPLSPQAPAHSLTQLTSLSISCLPPCCINVQVIWKGVSLGRKTSPHISEPEGTVVITLIRRFQLIWHFQWCDVTNATLFKCFLCHWSPSTMMLQNQSLTGKIKSVS